MERRNVFFSEKVYQVWTCGFMIVKGKNKQILSFSLDNVLFFNSQSRNHKYFQSVAFLLSSFRGFFQFCLVETSFDPVSFQSLELRFLLVVVATFVFLYFILIFTAVYP